MFTTFSVSAFSQTTALMAAGGGMTRREALPAIGALFGLPWLIGSGCTVSDSIPGGPQDGGVIPDAGRDTYLPPTAFTVEEGWALLACQFPPDLDSYASRLFGVCTGSSGVGMSELFSLNPTDDERPIPLTTHHSFGELGTRTLNHMAFLSDRVAVVVSDDLNGPSGIYEVVLDGSEAPNFIEFPPGHTFAGGPVRIGSKLFVPTANFDATNFIYNPGTVLVYDIPPTGRINPLSVRIMATTGYNPTGTAQLDDNTLLVLNSGDFSTEAVASLDVVDVFTETVIRNIPLGQATAQVAGELAVTGDRRAIVGTADGRGRVFIADLDESEVQELTLPGTTFHVSIRADDHLFYLTDFGGTVSIVTLANLALVHSLQVATGGAGPSELIPQGLAQVVPFGIVLIKPT